MGERGSKNMSLRTKLRNARKSKHKADLRMADDIRRLRDLLADAVDAFDEMTGDYPKELVALEEWYEDGQRLLAVRTAASAPATPDRVAQVTASAKTTKEATDG